MGWGHAASGLGFAVFNLQNQTQENGVQETTLWRRVLGVEQTTVIEAIEYDEDQGCVIAHVRPSARLKPCCGKCGQIAGRYDPGEGRRRWRGLDLGTVPVYLEADAPRVRCWEHGVTVARVPWARHGAGHTRCFDDQTAWLASITSKAAATELMRIAWRTVGSIITRVWADTEAEHDLLAGLTRIGIDEISYRKGQKYLTVVVDHDTGRLVWASPGRDKQTVRRFFDELETSGQGRCQQVTHVTADGAEWISSIVTERCPDAVLCADPFHVVKWATDALDQVRREAWNNARKTAQGVSGRAQARAVKDSRYALWKNPENLTIKQAEKLAWIQKTDPRLHRAYLLKEGLRTIFRLDPETAAGALDKWVTWARRCRIPVFVKLQRTIVQHRDRILAAIEHHLSNGRIEAVNTKIRLLTRIAFGFRSTDALTSLAMLTLGGHRPRLPGR